MWEICPHVQTRSTAMETSTSMDTNMKMDTSMAERAAT